MRNTIVRVEKDECNTKHFNHYDQLIRIEYVDGSWFENKYNDNGDIIETEDSKGYKEFYTYNVVNQLIRYRDSLGKDIELRYDGKGNREYIIDHENNRWARCVYDYNKNTLHIEDSDGYEEFYRFNNKGYITYYKDSDGCESFWEFDEEGVLINGYTLTPTGYKVTLPKPLTLKHCF